MLLEHQDLHKKKSNTEHFAVKTIKITWHNLSLFPSLSLSLLGGVKIANFGTKYYLNNHLFLATDIPLVVHAIFKLGII